MSGGEIIVIFLIVLLLFGSKKIPDFARTLGKAMHQFEKAKNDIQDEISRAAIEGEDFNHVTQTFQSEIEQMKADLNQGKINHTTNKSSEMAGDVEQGSGI